MSLTKNPILIIDDDQDDLEIVVTALIDLKLPNALITFNDPEEFILYLKSMDKSPFFIISDFNMPKMNGLQLRKQIVAHPDLKFRSVPFIIWSTSAVEEHVRLAYDNLIQGYFEKPSSLRDVQTRLSAIIEYWKYSLHPKQAN